LHRPTHAIIDLNAARRNLERVRKWAPGRRLMAVVKADGYGHGIERIADAFALADAFGVCCLDEAHALRRSGREQEVVLLAGCAAAEELREAAALKLSVVVHAESQLRLLERASPRQTVRAWLTLDRAMHRLGFPPEAVAVAWRRLRGIASVKPPVRLMTHLAAASTPGHSLNALQLRRFSECVNGLEGERSIANSAALMTLPESHADWLRPGLILYGASPLPQGNGTAAGLRPVMSLRSRLIAVRQMRAGERVGYGGNWSCPADMPVGIVAAGYGDGYPRHAAAGTPVLVGGKMAALIPPASMDLLAVDLRACPRAKIGDPVTLWGKELPVETVAAQADTIPHQLLCSLGRRVRIVERGLS